MNRADMRSNIQLDLADTTLTTNLLNRGIQRAVNDLSNILPRQSFEQKRVDFRKSKTFTATGSEQVVDLGDKFIGPKTEVIQGLRRNTDYAVDYLNGRVTVYTSAPLNANEMFTVTYTILEVIIDISDITENLVRVRKIEYPAGVIPQLYPDFEVDRDNGMITVKSREIPILRDNIQDTVDTQQELVDDEYMWIYYDEAHDVPTDTARGSYQPILDETVIKGAEYYASYAEALRELHTASTTIGSALTALNNLSVPSFSTTVPSLSVDISSVRSDTLFTNISTLLTRIQDQTDHTVSERIAKRVLDVLAAIDTQIASVTTQLDSISYTDYENILSDAGSTDDVEGDLSLAAAAWTDVKKWLEESGGHEDANAQDHLDQGEALINVLTTGERAASVRAEFARVATGVSQIYMQRWSNYIAQAQTRLALARAYHEENVLKADTARITVDRPGLEIQEANAFTRYMESFINALAIGINEGLGIIDRKIALLNLDLQEYDRQLAKIDREMLAYDRTIEGIDREIAVANSQLTAADRYLASGRSRLEQALVLRDEYFAELNNRLSDLRSVPALPA